MALALYRKYRPRTFDELVGQEANVEVLKNAARQDRFAHAYLFYGSRGTGKTTTARLIAKLLNCETRQNDAKFRAKGEPCNDCRSCGEIDAGSSLDVIEIDAASNRGIEEIRNLKENIKAVPAGGRHKVYIIDEAHMLTGPAFNALLKTLEEPPAHAVFVLATTEYDKLPPTIVSRTQRFLFKKLPRVKILEKLKEIAKAEQVEAEPAALEVVAAAAEGSLRDAESVLDQIAAGGKVTLASVEEVTGRVGLRKVDGLAELMVSKDLPKALAYVAALSEEGHNLVQLTRDLIHYIRKIVTLRASPEAEPTLSLELTAEEIARLKDLGGRLSPEDGVRYVRALIQAYAEMRYSPFATIPLEVALIEQLGK